MDGARINIKNVLANTKMEIPNIDCLGTGKNTKQR